MPQRASLRAGRCCRRGRRARFRGGRRRPWRGGGTDELLMPVVGGSRVVVSLAGVGVGLACEADCGFGVAFFVLRAAPFRA